MSTETGVRAHRFNVGAITCTIVSDGTMGYQNPAPLFFVNAPESERNSLFAHTALSQKDGMKYTSPYSARC